MIETVASGVEVWLAARAGMGEILFRTALVFSLTMGLIAAYPANLLLIHFGVKEGKG